MVMILLCDKYFVSFVENRLNISNPRVNGIKTSPLVNASTFAIDCKYKLMLKILPATPIIDINRNNVPNLRFGAVLNILKSSNGFKFDFILYFS